MKAGSCNSTYKQSEVNQRIENNSGGFTKTLCYICTAAVKDLHLNCLVSIARSTRRSDNFTMGFATFDCQPNLKRVATADKGNSVPGRVSHKTK